MSRPSGFTDAELAAAAWRRNMQLQASLKDSQHGGGALSGQHKEERKSNRKNKKDGKPSSRKAKKKRKGSSSSALGGKRGRGSRSASVGSVDSLGRERKRSRSPSLSGSLDDRRGPSRRKKRAREDALRDDELAVAGAGSLGWRGLMARRGASVSPSRERKGWSSAGSLGSASSERGTDEESGDDGYQLELADTNGWDNSAGNEKNTQGKLAEIDPDGEVPADPKRPDHDDRVQRFRGGWKAGVSVTATATANARRGFKGRGIARAFESDGDSDQSDGRYGRRGRRRQGNARGNSRGFDRDGRRGSRESRSRRHRSRSPGDGSSARSLSRSISRDRRSRRSSRSRSPSFRRSRSRDRTPPCFDDSVSSLIQHYSRKGSPDGSNDKSHAAGSVYGPADRGGNGSKRQADLETTWTHDLYDEAAGESPKRTNLPPDYKPEQPTWVSRAGGVYMPLKPS